MSSSVEEVGTSGEPSSIEARSLETSSIETILVVEEDENPSPADYVLRCKDERGQVIRYKTHKQALIQGSTFFRDMFAACTSNNEVDKNCTTDDDLDELEMQEDSFVVFVFVRSMYGGGAALQKFMSGKATDDMGSHSRRLMVCLRTAVKYRASRMAEIAVRYICDLWDPTRSPVPKTMRQDLIETWVLCKNNDELFAFPPSSTVEMTIKRSASCFAIDGLLDLVDTPSYACISLFDYKILSKLLFDSMDEEEALDFLCSGFKDHVKGSMRLKVEASNKGHLLCRFAYI